MKLHSLLSTTALVAAGLFITTPVLAQDAPGADSDAPEEDEPEAPTTEVEAESGEEASTGDEVVVTGSRIRRPNLESNVPITSVGAEELLDQGALSLGDALNDLPSLRSTFSTANSQRFIGTTGLNLLDLRGLGTNRTLVLVNGRRHVAASAGDFDIDVNTIPFELLERTDVVTGGSSAVYGSDAIAGVVNFILKRDYDGISARGQGGISSRGDRGAYFGSIVAGQNFADGRGNIAATAEYSKSNRVRNIDRPRQTGSFFGFNAFIQTDDTVGEPSTGDGIPDNTFERNLRYGFISEGGTVVTFCLGNPATQPLGCDANGEESAFRFDENGRLFRDTFEQDFRPTSGNFVRGGRGSTLSDYGLLYPEIERYTANILGRFDVTEALKPFIEAKYSRLNAALESSPTFSNSFSGGLAGLGGLQSDPYAGAPNSVGTAIFFDNAFLNPQDAALLRSLQQELILNAGGTPAQAASTRFFRLARNNLDFGSRAEDLKRETYRIVGGIEGDFNDDWRYELSANYGRFKGEIVSQNNLLVQNFRNAADAVRNAQGQIVCRINADASTANDDPACVPVNVLGANRASQAALDYFLVDSTFTEEAEQFDVLGFVNGDLSQLFEFPGGPIRFVIGGEYRTEESERVVDPIVRQGRTFLTALADFDPPKFKVAEAFGELQFPILRNVPFAEELEFSAAARYSDYNRGAGNTNKTFAYNLAGVYAPISDLRIRANLSRAVRAPTPSALFSVQSQNFAFLTDPCDRRFINNGPPQRLANCRSNTPIGNVPPEYQQQSGNRSILQGGNPELEEEKSDSFTVGAILQPRFLPGFSLTVDYYDIEVDNVIGSLSGNAILQQCYDSEDFPNNQFCNLVGARQPGGLLNATAAVTVSTVNFAKLVARGIDADLAYRRTFDNGDRLSLRAIATYNLERTNFLDVLNPDVPNRVKSELGDPTFAANFGASYRRGVVTLGYDLRYIGRQTIGLYEAQNSFNGNPPTNPDQFPRIYYPDVFYHDIRADFTVGNDYVFYVGVDNVGDRLPPLGLTGVGAGSGIFDNIGRFFYAGARVNF